MKRTVRLFLAAMALLFLGFLLAASSHGASPGYTDCGARASGRAPDGRLMVGAFPRQFVGPDGAWHTCQPWVPDGGDPATPEPKPDVYCPARTTYEFWEVDGLVCSSIPPGVSNSTTTMLRRTLAGRAQLIRGEWGNPQGLLVMRCTLLPDGTAAWKQEGATCAYAP